MTDDHKQQQTNDNITTDTVNKKDNVDYGTKVRNADPTNNAQDFGLDPTGRYETIGSAQDSSAQINEVPEDTSVLRGTVDQNNPDTDITYKTTGEEVSDKEYEKQVRQGMSDVAADKANDIGSEEET